MERGVQTGAHIGQEERRTCMAAIEVRHLYKRFEQKGVTVEALSDINLTVEQGDIYGIIGMSGAGKSTLVRCLNFLEKPTEGQVLIEGQELGALTEKELRGQRSDIAMIFQNFNLLMQKSVLDNVCFPMQIQEKKKKEARERARELLKTVGLSEKEKAYPAQLSGGQRQRVALGRAIVREPKVFLMDEPLSNLDAKLRAQMRTEIIKLHQKLQTTIIYVTHDQTEAMTMGSRIVGMKDGYIQQVDSPQVLYEKPVNMFVAGFIGSPQMNFIDVKVEKQGADIYLRMGRWTVKLPEQKAEKILAGGYVEKTVVMGIRPEAVHDEQMYLEAYKDSQIECKVEVVELLGAESLVYMMLENTLFVARVKPRNNIYVGDTMRFALNPNKVHIFDKETENIICN